MITYVYCHATTGPPKKCPAGLTTAAAGGPLDHLWHFRWSSRTIDCAIVGPPLPQLVP